MLTITNYTVELIKDPFGILTGKRYEFILDLDIPEEDELYSPSGVYARVVLKVDGNKTSMISNDLLERSTQRILDFDMEEDEEQVVMAFCKEHLPES
ncbi:MAG: pullulanase [Gorillibacterium sp.]|nr:pullulanase [Gorillibacterium sp.]